LGLGGTAIVKNAITRATQGFDSTEWAAAIVAMIVIFVGATVFSLFRKHMQDKTVFAVTVKKKMQDLYMVMLQQIRRRYLDLAKERTPRSLADIRRRMKVHFDLYLSDRRAEWRAAQRTIEEDREQVIRQLKKLNDLDELLASALRAHPRSF